MQLEMEEEHLKLVNKMNLNEFLVLDLEERFGLDALETHDTRNASVGTVRETYGIKSLSIIKKIFQNDKNRELGHKYQQRLMGESCTQCGAREVYCGYVDLGGPDFYDNSWHICLNCLDAKHAEVFSSRQSGDADCWFCSFPW